MRSQKGRLPRGLAEKIAEVRLVSKAPFRRDFAKRVIGHQRERLSARDARAHDILMRRATKALLEYSVAAGAEMALDISGARAMTYFVAGLE